MLTNHYKNYERVCIIFIHEFSLHVTNTGRYARTNKSEVVAKSIQTIREKEKLKRKKIALDMFQILKTLIGMD